MTVRVRPTGAADAAGIRRVLTAAFPSAAEADLVERLEAAGDLAIGFVAVDGDEPVGAVAFSRMNVVADDVRVPALALAPIAVVPERQREGIGTRLVQSGLAAANGRGVSLVFVLGDPAIYGRYGFRAETAAPFASAHAGPHFLAQWLSSPRTPASGRADHAPAFAALP